MSKPFSQACENNKADILSVISQYFLGTMNVLEIGSYTAQHAQFFAENLPAVSWQPTEIADNFSLLQSALQDVSNANILSPLELDVCHHPWPVEEVGGIFSANTLHIMPEVLIADFFLGAGKVLKTGGYLCVYGPFKYAGKFTSESNARFQQWLESQHPLSGIRDSEKVISLAHQQGLTFISDHLMAANNQTLVFKK